MLKRLLQVLRLSLLAAPVTTGIVAFAQTSQALMPIVSHATIDPRSLAAGKDRIEADAKQGVTSSQYQMGLIYLNGLGVYKDNVQAVHWFEKAAVAGNIFAANDLAILMLKGYTTPSGKQVAPQPSKGLDLLRYAALGGHPPAKHSLAMYYLNGLKSANLPADSALAIGLLEDTSRALYPPSLGALALLMTGIDPTTGKTNTLLTELQKTPEQKSAAKDRSSIILTYLKERGHAGSPLFQEQLSRIKLSEKSQQVMKQVADAAISSPEAPYLFLIDQK